jgi:putative phosphoesterase
MKRIGVISDTHGLVRPQLAEVFRGVELILHAGDIGGAAALEELGRIAPVKAVRGNVDTGEWCAALPRAEAVQVDGALLYLLHNLSELDLDPAAAGVRVVIHGHSHQPKGIEAGGVLYFNPGSAGPRRLQSPVTAGLLRVGEGRAEGEIVTLVP